MRKKMLLIPLALLLAVSLVACAAPAPPTTTAPAPAPTTTVTAPAAAPAPAPAEEVFSWRLQHFTSPGDDEYDGAVQFINQIREMSDGRVDITIYPFGALIPTMDMVDAVAEGVVEVGMASPCYWPGMDPAFDMLWSLPFGLPSLEIASNFYWDRGGMDFAREVYAAQNVYLLGMDEGTGYGSMMSSVPIYSIDDLKGLKVRTFGIYGEVVKEAGGSVVSIPAEETYLALATGVADAAMWAGPGGFWQMKFHETCKYVTMPSWGYAVYSDTFINVDAWNELPDDLKKIMSVAEELLGPQIFRRRIVGDVVALSKMQKEWGVTVCWWDEEALSEARAVAVPLWDELATGSDFAAEGVRLYKDYMRELGLIE